MASLSIELCAFNVAIALVCKPSSLENHQWTVETLIEELRNSDMGADPNFRVDILPLHQGSLKDRLKC